MDKIQAPEIEAMVRFARAGLLALSERVLTLLGLIMSFSLAGWSMLEPTWQRGAIVAAFAILVYWPLVRLETKRKE